MAVPSSDARGAEAVSPDARRFLVFTIEAREFGLPLDTIVEIIGYRSATPVPHPEPAIEGIVPLRGRVVTLLDMRRFLARPDRPSGARPQVIVIESSGDLLGLVVDAVTRVVTASAAPEPPQVVEGLERPAMIKGILKRDDGPVVLLDLEAILGGLA